MPVLNILLADDDSLVRAVVAEEIEEAGHCVCAVRGGEEALAALATESFDIVLMDYAMPGMMGAEAARRIRQAWPHQPIAILTGYGDLLEISGRAGDFPVIPKGRMDAILKAIVAVAEGERLPPPSSPESRWEEIQRRMAATANSQLVGQNLRALYSEPPDEPLPALLEALLGETSEPAVQPAPERDMPKRDLPDEPAGSKSSI
jgi:CheY-like chemotaxis protein